MINHLLLTAILLNVFIKEINGINGIMSVTQVKAGEQVTLLCLSNDDDHRFMFWQLDDNNIVGPGNYFNELKYNYEVLTGRLFIRSVSTKESGFYQCISRGVDNRSAYNVHTVELIVLKNANGFESDFEMNLLRALTAVMIIIVIIAFILAVIMKKHKRNKKFLDLQAARANGVEKYQPRSQTITMEPSNGIDNPGLDADFPKVFKHHNEQALP